MLTTMWNIGGRAVDLLPAWLWRPGNLHLGFRLHFCYDNESRRTIQWNNRDVATGRRTNTFHGHG